MMKATGSFVGPSIKDTVFINLLAVLFDWKWIFSMRSERWLDSFPSEFPNGRESKENLQKVSELTWDLKDSPIEN